MRALIVGVALAVAPYAPPHPHSPHPLPISASHFHKLAHTYSIVAVDPANGDLGVAVQSKFPNVGGVVPWAKAGVGAVATQALTDTTFGDRGLQLMEEGATAEEALRILTRGDQSLQDRQVGIVDARSNSASFSGKTTFDWAGGESAVLTARRAASPAARASSSPDAATPRRRTSWSRTRP